MRLFRRKREREIELLLPGFEQDTSGAFRDFQIGRRWLAIGGWAVALAMLALLTRGLWQTSAGISISPLAADVSGELESIVSVISVGVSPLQLSLTRSGSGLSVAWNKAAAIVRTAQCGALTIQEGGRRKNISLNRDALGVGAFSHSTTEGDVSFHMDLLTSDRRLVSSELRFLDGAMPQRYTPATARFAALPSDEGPLTGLGSAEAITGQPVSVEGLCGAPMPPVPGQRPHKIVAARVIGGPAFDIPADVMLTHSESVSISAEVFLDPNGRILDIQGPSSTAYRRVSDHLMNRMREWRFSPATLDEAPVASSIKFDFLIQAGA